MDRRDYLFERQALLVAEVEKAIAEAIAAESRLDAQQSQTTANIKSDYHTRRKQRTAKYEQLLQQLRTDHAEKQEALTYQYESDSYRLAQHHGDRMRNLETNRRAATDAARKHYDQACEVAEQRRAAVLAEIEQRKTQVDQECEHDMQRLEQLMEAACALLKRWRMEIPSQPVEPAPGERSDPHQRFEAACGSLHQTIEQLRHRPAALFLEQGWPILLAVFSGLAMIYPVGWLVDWNLWLWPPLVLLGSLAVGFGLHGSLKPRVRRAVQQAWPGLLAAEGRARRAVEDMRNMAIGKKMQAESDLATQIDEAMRIAGQQWVDSQRDIAARFDSQTKEVQDEFQRRKAELTAWRKGQADTLPRQLTGQMNAVRNKFQADLTAQDAECQTRLEAVRYRFEHQWTELMEKWHQSMTRLHETSAALSGCWEQGAAQAGFVSPALPWGPPREDDAAEAPSDDAAPTVATEFAADGWVLPIGYHRLDLDDAHRRLPQTKGLRPPASRYQLPVALVLPERPCCVLEVDGNGRDAAARVLQIAMLRFLTRLPPGKVRLTVIDPLGSGQDFAPFMHLADFDERLINGRIWTEPAQVNQRLADLTAHMETVIQAYLRGEFESVHQYNQQAGEVAEPFHVLVVANFPHGFSDEAAARLARLATSGPGCGIYTLVSVDANSTLPGSFHMADLQRHALTLRWNGRRLYAEPPQLQALPLEIDPLPPEPELSQTIKRIGTAAQDAYRVEVPFSTVAAPEQDWWSSDSRDGLRVPLGRAGATRLQYFELGEGTAQHVLIAGKTGSGKSTLLNALVTNASMWYSPDEVEFYLVDFKKGVEFKPYATHGLPHARVVAIESEREFGMSVLERLDVELKNRGELFRQHRVADLKSFRNAHPERALPRVLLIVDEFQEFFVQEDRLAQDAALLLDRLVRQGRAFGIHVVLGSQTLAGAYTLARSTLSQMAVRIALQCSESDAHLILSDDNTAARLLGRPGEAIYNDAGGLPEGNHPFQVVWLPEHERRQHLQAIRHFAGQQHVDVDDPVVFEGSTLADLGRSKTVAQYLRAPEAPGTLPRVLVGEPVSIRPSLAIDFPRHSAANLLIVGQQEEVAAGLLGSAVALLGSGIRHQDAEATGPSITLLNGTRPESPPAELWYRLLKDLPVEVDQALPRNAEEAIAGLHRELHMRLENEDETRPPWFLVIANLARFRNLQQTDEFAMESFQPSSPSAADRLMELLREGPAVGMHTIVWADSYGNMTRWLGRQALREFDFRILLPMNAADSSNLMDSVAASQLAVNRAYLYRHDLAAAEKFRPFGFPSDQWIQSRLAAPPVAPVSTTAK